MRAMVRCAATLLLLAGAVLAQSGSRDLPDKPTPSLLPSREVVNAFMHRMFGFDPSVKWTVLDIRPSEVPGMALVVMRVGEGEGRLTTLHVAADGKRAIAGEVIPFGADPFADVRKELERRATGPSRGAKPATVMLVEFADLQCPACRTAQPTLDRLLAEVPGARLVFQHFPLESLHPWAFRASSYADCIARSDADAFWRFLQTVYEHQAEITPENSEAKFQEYVTAVGLKAGEMRNCANALETGERVRQSFALGRELGVSATPTVFVNGRKVPLGGFPYEKLKAIVEFEGTEAAKR